VETIVPDTKVKEVIDAIKQDGTVKGKMFISDVLESLDFK
jgi:nitrogen regulatory protein PII